MPISYSIYSNGNATSKTVALDFVNDYLASSSNGVSDNPKYFFKFTTAATDEDGNKYGARVSESLSDVALNSANPGTSRQRLSNTAAAYGDVKSMVVDYLADYVLGHDPLHNGTTVAEQKPMKFN